MKHVDDTREPSFQLARSSVIVLDDDEGALAELCRVLYGAGVSQCLPVSGAPEFRRAFTQQRFDAASVDLMLGQHFEGVDLIGELKREGATLGFLACSAYEIQREHVLGEGADLFLLKKLGSLAAEGYVEGMVEVTKRGVLRSIARAMGSLAGAQPVPQLDVRRLLVTAVSEAEGRSCRESAVQHLVEDLGKFSMCRIESREYAELPLMDKIAAFGRWLRLSEADLASILGVGERTAQGLLEGRAQPAGVQPALEALLSCWSYLLRVAEYDAERLRLQWTLRDAYETSCDPPPWDSVGLLQYLRAGGDGLIGAIRWIRSQ